MPVSTSRQGLTRTSIAAVLLLMALSAHQTALADGDLEIGFAQDGDDAEHLLLQGGGEDEDGVVSSDPQEDECGETVENSRC